ncbi:unnamed protein product [Calypogeia fissa]
MGKYQNVVNQALSWQFNKENPPARVLKISLNDLAIKVLDASDDLRNLDLDERRCIYGTPLCEWVIPKLEVFSAELQQPQTLQYLSFERCADLTLLPESLGHLWALKHLTVSECSNLLELPDSIGDLGALEYVELKGCHSLVYLPESLGQLRTVNHLLIEGCISLQHLPVSFGQLQTLETLMIHKCKFYGGTWSSETSPNIGAP